MGLSSAHANWSSLPRYAADNSEEGRFSYFPLPMHQWRLWGQHAKSYYMEGTRDATKDKRDIFLLSESVRSNGIIIFYDFVTSYYVLRLVFSIIQMSILRWERNKELFGLGKLDSHGFPPKKLAQDQANIAWQSREEHGSGRQSPSQLSQWPVWS